MKYFFYACAFLVLSCSSEKKEAIGANEDWPNYQGDNSRSQYSHLQEINRDNVSQLKVSWTYSSNDISPEDRTQVQCNPLIINGVMYGSSPTLKIFALNAATGKEIWQFDPFKNGENHPLGVNRGVTYWEYEGDERILFSAGPFLYALDARTGQPIKSFGENGKTSLKQSLGRDPSGLFVISTTPGVVYQDLIIIGTRVSENAGAAPGHIRAFNIKTGEVAWTFHTIPQPGEFGYDTWPKEAYKTTGGANSWSGMSLDEQRGMVFIPTGSASFDFYGGDRHGINLFANCILALDASTGERIWHFQTVHHDLWDRDLPSPPNLLTVTHDGKEIDAVAQITKQGYVFLLDRETGKPLFPVEERKVPTSDIKGEATWPTQPVPVRPAPFARQIDEFEPTTLTPEANRMVSDSIQKLRKGEPWIPPSLEGTLLFPGYDGGGEWGGAAFDPATGLLYVNGNEMPWLLQLTEVPAAEEHSLGKSIFTANCAVCHGTDRKGDETGTYPSLVNIEEKYEEDQISAIVTNGRGIMPAFGHLGEEEVNALVMFLTNPTASEQTEGPQKEAMIPSDDLLPYAHTGYHRFFDQEGYPAVTPPWGTLNAIDLNKGEIVWKIPLGEYEELTERGIPVTGTENYGGPIVTAGGIIFIAATKDEKFRAFDKENGELLWETSLPAGGYATPSTYSINGKQYVVIACGGGKMGTKSGDQYVAFALE